MQDVNNDMDDLFRQAAEQYPLRTDEEDWSKVLQGLQRDDIPAPALTDGKQKRTSKIPWLLLLMPLALLCITLPHNLETRNKPSVATQKEKQTKIADENKQTSVKALENYKGSLKNKEQKDNNNREINIDNHLQNSVANQKNTQGKESVINNYKHETNRQSVVLQTLNNNKQESKFATQPSDKTYSENNSTLNGNNIKNKQPDVPSSRIQNTETVGENSNTTLQQKQLVTDTMGLHKVDSSGMKTTAETNTKSKITKAVKQNQHGFYTGLLASFDISTIKLQKVNKTGYSINVMAGYRFSKHISVESGIDWSSKKYYSKGQYFDKTRTGIPTLSEIIYTNGTCQMFEIPIAFKYDFVQKAKSNLFATAGLSSYLMKKEDYTYYANHTGNYYTATKTYNNSGNNLFSVATVSVGYQLNINKHIALRAEPYLKMPLTGIGIAKLPITSTGISVGFTRSF